MQASPNSLIIKAMETPAYAGVTIFFYQNIILQKSNKKIKGRESGDPLPRIVIC